MTAADPAPPELEEDCGRCAALCCIAHAFDAGPDFAADKPSDVPCTHLAPGACGCSIHAKRAEAGYGGCIVYSCHGAGQYVTEAMFEGQTWQERPETLAAMTAAFRDLVVVQRWRILLETAASLPLPPDRAAERERLSQALLPPEGETWTGDALAALHRSALPSEITAFLRSLRAHVSRDAPP